MKLVWVNGCFDGLHPGHEWLLYQAAGYGQRLVVGVNSDESVRRLKGPGRPVHCLAERINQLASFSTVDWVVVFWTDNPCEEILRIRPEVVVKSSEYAPGGKPCPERDVVLKYGGQVVYLDRIPGHSSTDRLKCDSPGKLTF